MVRTQRRARAFTLIELVVVIAVLALIAALVVPKMMDIYDRSRSGTQAYSLSDIDRQINIYYALNHKYPEGWDSLLTAVNPSTEPSGVYAKLAPTLTAAGGYIVTTPHALTADQITSLNNAGVSHMFAHDATTTDVNYSASERHHLGVSGTTGHDGTANLGQVLTIDTTFDTTTHTGSKGYNLLVNDFGLGANTDGANVPSRIAAHTYVVFGLGYKSSIVQAQIEEAPVLENAASASSYARALCVFEIPNTGTEKALLVGVLGPDGRTKREALSDYANGNGEQPH